MCILLQLHNDVNCNETRMGDWNERRMQKFDHAGGGHLHHEPKGAPTAATMQL